MREIRWSTPSSIGTSIERDRCRDSVESSDTSRLSPGEERCRIVQEITFLLHPGQLTLERERFLVPRHAQPGNLSLSFKQIPVVNAPESRAYRSNAASPESLSTSPHMAIGIFWPLVMVRWSGTDPAL